MPSFLPLKRKSDADTSAPNKRLEANSSEPDQYWAVQWRNYQARKHKTWDGDGVLVVSGFTSRLHDSDGKVIASGKRDVLPYHVGRNLNVGGKDLELDRPLTSAEYLSGECFGKASFDVAPSSSSIAAKSTANKPFVSLKQSRAVPLQPVNLLSTSNRQQTTGATSAVAGSTSYWTANWRAPHQKTWAGDCFVSNIDGKMSMLTEEGKILGTTLWKGDTLSAGYKLYIGGKEIQLDCQVPPEDVPSLVAGPDKTVAAPDTSSVQLAVASPTSKPKPFVAPASFYGASKPKPIKPLHDPNVEGAVVMKTPSKEHIKRFNKKNLPVIDVVLDPILASRMRPHQIEGDLLSKRDIQLVPCLGCILADEMGLGKTLQTISLIWTLLKQNPYAGAGPVVGKALIVCPVTLINNWKAEFIKWLGRDRLGKAIALLCRLLLTPSGVVTVTEKDKNSVRTFLNAKNQHVLIVGYERLRTVIEQLTYCMPPIGLIVCDEGHRLKSASSKTTTMFEALKTTRRILLSGTPIQNDLGEFHAMADFCNPGLLDDYQTFKRVYENPILKGRSPDSSTKERELGEARLAKLNSVTTSFVLRREASLLMKYLPPKHEYVVFIKPTPLQLQIFSKILNPSRLEDLVQSSTAESLALIGLLTKVSNSPVLLKAVAEKNKSVKHAGVRDALQLLPQDVEIEDMSLSGKLIALSKLLKSIYQAFCQKKRYSFYRVDGQTPTSKRQEYVNLFNKSSQRSAFIFLLSSKAGGVGINLIGGSRLCLIDSDWNPSHDEQSMARCHRDGQKRPVHIYRFLTSGQQNHFPLDTSTNFKQGAIDEKIFQRQVTKQGLRESLIGTASTTSSSDSFSRKDLRDIFRIHPDTVCNTHDLLSCRCDGREDSDVDEVTLDTIEASESDSDQDSDVEKPTTQGFMSASQVRPSDLVDMDKSYLRKKQQQLQSLSHWKHINCLLPSAQDEIQDELLRTLVFIPEQKVPERQPQSKLLAALDAAMAQTVTVGELPGDTFMASLAQRLREGTQAVVGSVTTHRILVYSLFSFLAVSTAITNALRNYSNFYSVAIYLSKSSRSVLILANFGFLVALLAGHLVQKVFFGALRPSEIERLYDRLWFFITESLLAFTIFRDEFDITFVVMFGFLLFVKSFHWIAGDRIEWMDQRPYPGPPLLFHARMVTLFFVLWSIDVVLFMIAVESTVTNGIGGMYGILMATVTNTVAKYILSAYELRRAGQRGGENAPPWENKSMWVFYIELATDFLKLSTYMIFFTIIMTYYGIPLNILRDVYVTGRSLITRLRSLHRYQTATRNMDQRYPNATEEDMTTMNDHTCIICREEMVLPRQEEDAPPPPSQEGPNTTPKKLPCGHIFHFNCLRSWLERQQSCPTCRRNVLETTTRPQQGPAPPLPDVNRAGPADANANANNAALMDRFFAPPQNNQGEQGPVPFPPNAQNPPAPGGLLVQYRIQYQAPRPPNQPLQPIPPFAGFDGPAGAWHPWPEQDQPVVEPPVEGPVENPNINPQPESTPREAAALAALRRLNRGGPSTTEPQPRQENRFQLPSLIPMHNNSPSHHHQLPPALTNEQLAILDSLTREAIDERLRVLEGVSGAVNRCIDDLMRMRSVLPLQIPPAAGEAEEAPEE
ncbi:hypothetical protein MIND_00044100 [Mycena indigotica]|uniref:Uncharacterized protein n=1 Tax=Mycena indigotica TaxID=2126181 RepID=A0A8H6TEK4_9AGAR|nr:uncharacterized protein MIND_00044100 [Mycena indigotica]KAF7315296.1 hypothetical protein MIND_00044100 [Mycena indigotica]